MKPFREATLERVQLGLCVMWPSPGAIERIGPDWDWVWLDGQHGILGYNDILDLVRICNLVGRYSVVRVPGHGAGPIGKVLDTGADGVMVPMVDTPEQAEGVVKAAKFPPLGDRSYGGRRVIDLYGRGYCGRQGGSHLVVCQIETETAVKNAEAIAAVEGVDALFFGADDLSLRMGLPMDQASPPGYHDKSRQIVADAAHAHGKLAGGIFANPKSLVEAVEMGFHLVVGAADCGLMGNASREQRARLEKALKST